LDPKSRFFGGVGPCFEVFIDWKIAPMCIFVEEYSTIRKFLTDCVNMMVANSSLDQQANASGCYNSWFMHPLILMDVN
jgi:hypothetical protein